MPRAIIAFAMSLWVKLNARKWIDFFDSPTSSAAFIGDTSTSLVASIAAGEVRLSGVIEAAEVSLVSPLQSRPCVYYRATVRGEPLLLVRGRYEHSDRNRNVLVRELVSLAPLARRLTD